MNNTIDFVVLIVTYNAITIENLNYILTILLFYIIKNIGIINDLLSNPLDGYLN